MPQSEKVIEMFCFHYIGQITCCKNKLDGSLYYSLYLPTQSWAQRDNAPSFQQADLDWCKSFTKDSHILHKENVKELNKFAGSDLYSYRMADDMQSVNFSLKSNKKSFTATLINSKISITENN